MVFTGYKESYCFRTVTLICLYSMQNSCWGELDTVSGSTRVDLLKVLRKMPRIKKKSVCANKPTPVVTDNDDSDTVDNLATAEQPES